MVLDNELKDLSDINEVQDFLNKKIFWKIFNAIKYSKNVGIKFNTVDIFNRHDYCDIYCVLVLFYATITGWRWRQRCFILWEKPR